MHFNLDSKDLAISTVADYFYKYSLTIETLLAIVKSRKTIPMVSINEDRQLTAQPEFLFSECLVYQPEKPQLSLEKPANSGTEDIYCEYNDFQNTIKSAKQEHEVSETPATIRKTAMQCKLERVLRKSHIKKVEIDKKQKGNGTLRVEDILRKIYCTSYNNE